MSSMIFLSHEGHRNILCSACPAHSKKHSIPAPIHHMLVVNPNYKPLRGGRGKVANFPLESNLPGPTSSHPI